MTIGSESRVYYDPYDADINADPYPTYARLRDEAPIYYNERYDVWALARHADVEKALVNWQTFSNIRSDILEIIQSGMELPSGVVLFEDPPLHTMHRGLMSRVFTAAHERARRQGAGVLPCLTMRCYVVCLVRILVLLSSSGSISFIPQVGHWSLDMLCHSSSHEVLHGAW